jgi:hypothetical protein
MNNKQLWETYQVLTELESTKGMPLKFQYGLARLLEKIKGVIDALTKVRDSQVEGEEEYTQEKQEILHANSNLDERGQPKTKTNGQQVEYDIKDMKKLEKQIAALNKKNEKTLEKMLDRQKQFIKLLEDDADLEKWEISVENLPVKDGASMLTVEKQNENT